MQPGFPPTPGFNPFFPVGQINVFGAPGYVPPPQPPGPPPPYHAGSAAFPQAGWMAQAQQLQQQPPAQQWVAPEITIPPMDQELRSTIDKTAAYVARNGVKFENMVREREGANPKFAFLHEGGEASKYYQWRTYVLQSGMTDADADKQLNEAFPQPVEEEGKEFERLLTNLSGSKESIRSVRSWIMTHEGCLDWICHMALQHMARVPDFNGRLYMIYAMNDVLHACLKKRPEPVVLDPSTIKMLPHMINMMALVTKDQEIDEEQRAKVTKVTGLWRERLIFADNEVTALEATFSSGTAHQPIPNQPPPAYPGPPAIQFQGPPPDYQPGAPISVQGLPGAPPPYHQGMGDVMMGGASPMQPGMQRNMPMGGAVPMPFPQGPHMPIMKPLWSTPDDMPPGLVVMVSNLMRSGGSPAYTPILPQICPLQPPPPQPQTQELLDSITRFYDEDIVQKKIEKQRQRKERQRLAEEEARAELEKKEAEEAERQKLLESRPPAEEKEGLGVARSQMNFCTPRKIVPKMSNQIVGLKRKEDDDDDVADVFKI